MAAKDPTLEFQTPPPVAEYMASLIPFETINGKYIHIGGLPTILEPTPGSGNLTAAVANEINKRFF